MKLIHLIRNGAINSITLVSSALIMSICCLIMLKLAELRRPLFEIDKQHDIFNCKNSAITKATALIMPQNLST